jgi:predicted methyltransferase
MDFSEVERFATHFDDPKRDAWQRPGQVLRHLALRPGDTVADIGAGTGYFLKRLSEAVGSKGKVMALDVEANMVVYMNHRARKEGLSNVEAKQVPPDAPGLLPESTNRILIVNTWHHIGAREQYSKRLLEALVPGGFVLVVDFTLESDIGPPRNHRLTPEQVTSELDAGGLDAEIVTNEALPKQYLVRGTRKR